MASTLPSLHALACAQDWAGFLARAEQGRLRVGLPMHQAIVEVCRHGQAACLGAVLGYVQPGRHDAEHFRAAAARGHLDCVELLLPYCGNYVSLALVDAAENNQAPVVKRLLDDPSCNPNLNGGLALSLALSDGPSCVALLWPRTTIHPVIQRLLKTEDFPALDAMTPWVTQAQGKTILNALPAQAPVPALRARMEAWREARVLRECVQATEPRPRAKIRL